MSSLYLVVAFQAFFFAFLILTKSKKSYSEYLLAAYFVVNSLVVLNFFYVSQLFDELPHFRGFTRSISFLPGPVLLLYTLSALQKKPTPVQILVHLSPFIVYNIVYMPYHLLSLEDKLTYDFRYPLIGKPVFEAIAAIVKVIIHFGYNGFVIYLVEKNKGRIQGTYSLIERRTLWWVNVAAGSTILIGLLSIVPYMEINETGYSISKETPVFIVYSLFLIVIGYFGYRQRPLGADEPLVDLATQKPTVEKQETADGAAKYKRSGLTQEMAEDIKRKIVESVESGKLYLNPDLNIYDLSKTSNIPTHHITEVLNQHMQRNFYDFINSYRVDEAKRLLKSRDHRNFTLEVIGYDAGFNSRSSFYNYFKKTVGMTPLEFQRKGLVPEAQG